MIESDTSKTDVINARKFLKKKILKIKEFQMKLKDFYLDIKSNNKDLIVFVKYGSFYKCFEDDSYIINYLLNYKINNKNSLGF